MKVMKGRAIISTATQAFESFLSNNALFTSDGECVVFIKNCINFARKNNILKYIDKTPKRKDVLKKLIKTYEFPKLANEDLIYKMLINCDKNELAVLMYKNNLYKFMEDSSIVRHNIKNIVLGCDNFVDPNKPPEHIKDLLEDTWNIFKKCVFYDHMVVDKMYRLENKKRKSIVVIDTDSNMINMHPFVCFVKESILHNDFNGKSSNEIRYNSLSTISFILTKLISKVFYNFMKYSNVPKQKRGLLKMKNEYLYKRMLISPGKKNYVGSIEYKEGKWMDHKLDVKGLTINKISSNANAGKFFKNIVKEDILESDEIDIPDILSKLQNFQEEMIESLKQGELTYLKPSRVKESRYYDNPLSEQPVRASYIWNELVDDIKIEPPDSVFIIKMISNTLEKMKPLKDIDPEMYNKIEEKIFNSEIKTIREKGVYVIAIPRNLDKVPEWIIPFIDVEAIVHDNMKNIIKILMSLGLNPISAKSTEKHFSGIVRL